MDQRSLNVLEYPKILAILKEFCVSDGAKEKAAALVPMEEAAAVRRALTTTGEALNMMLRNGRPPLTVIPKADDHAKRAAVGGILSMHELLSVASLLRIAKDMENYYYNDTQCDELIELKPLFTGLELCEMLEKEISRKILSDTEMADNASPELNRIRREITFKNNRISDKLNGLITSSANEKYLQDRIITIRNNRYVVPVKQEYRAKIPGIVLDRSSSGATLFIEPLAVVELNNDLKMLADEEEKEMQRILKELSEKTAAYKEEITIDYDLLTELDFQFAKGKYGLHINGQTVSVTESGTIAYKRARHPLIDPQKVVASDIYLEDGIHTMIVTGPNTGGKTVTLKTIGLLNLMVQSGMYVPVKEGSQTRLFKNIYADIGDEQSIEQSLSTFSSHMKNIVEIMSCADPDSLVLFDELGAGTDPTEGAALAISILDTLHKRGVTSVSTTHYSELKEYALVTEGVVNASVEFDVKTLRPTFRLLIGVPGKSNAFEIAKRLGLDEAIINQSKGLIKNEAIRFEETLIKIEEKRRKAEEEHAMMLRMKKEIEELKGKVEEEKRLASETANALIEKAQEEAALLVKKTREETEDIYREIRYIQESTAKGIKDNKKLEALRRQIKEQEKGIFDVYKIKKIEEDTALDLEDLKPGMKVHIKTLHKDGDVLKIMPKDEKVMVQTDNIKLKVSISDLTHAKSIARPQPKQTRVIRQTDRHTMETRLDLRGRNGEESLYLVDQMINDALLSGTHQLMIVHGKGTGRLRQIIHAYLKDNRVVKDFRLGAPNEGGSGVTVVEL